MFARLSAYPVASVAASSLLTLALFGRKDVRAEGKAASPVGKKYTVGVLGATGTVGQQFLKKLENVSAKGDPAARPWAVPTTK